MVPSDNARFVDVIAPHNTDVFSRIQRLLIEAERHARQWRFGIRLCSRDVTEARWGLASSSVRLNLSSFPSWQPGRFKATDKPWAELWPVSFMRSEKASARAIDGLVKSGLCIKIDSALRRECLDQTLFWTTTDLEAKLLDFRHYYNEHRTHTGLEGRLPDSGGPGSPIDFASYGWRKHRRGLYEPPIAA